MRPIEVPYGSPICNLATFVADILTNAYDSNNQYDIRDHFFYLAVYNYQISNYYIIIGLDFSQQQLEFLNLYFTYDGIIYKQILGSSVGATLSTIVAQHLLEQLVFSTIRILDFNLAFLYKYVEDLISVNNVGCHT